MALEVLAMRLLWALVLVVSTAGVQSPPLEKAERLPFQKKKITLESPSTYEKRTTRYNPVTGESIYYDPKPEVITLDQRNGTYGLRWIGYDGKEKTIIYKRPDLIDAVVKASASRLDERQYAYAYNVETSSAQDLLGFAVQNFASDVKPIANNSKRASTLPVEINNVLVGEMSNIKELGGGNWIGFGILPDLKPAVSPGRSIEFNLSSPAPPGVVECRIYGGLRELKGVGEEPPQELEDALPGVVAWPSSYTIGPVGRLRGISQQEQISYLLKILPQCKDQGWITARILGAYEQLLKQKNLQGLFVRAANDLKTNSITTEVFAIVEGLKGR
ncbi:MAG: hypothetical protein J2P21_11600 [Chloracidobacterium sp.]|nr:hypothetical protein [Chloracidobacterium sp.]